MAHTLFKDLNAFILDWYDLKYWHGVLKNG
jgi:hypothetical protein